MKRLVSVILATLCILLLTPVVSYSFPSGAGELTIVIEDADKRPLRGIDLALYRVADLAEEAGEAVYKPAPKFAGSRADFTVFPIENQEKVTPTDKIIELIDTLEKYIAANGISSDARKATGVEGKATFSGLDPGLYLVRLYNEAGTTYRMLPFLAPVPMNTENGWNYLITAHPKTEPEPSPSPSPSPSAPPSERPPRPEPSPSAGITPSPSPNPSSSPVPSTTPSPAPSETTPPSTGPSTEPSDEPWEPSARPSSEPEPSPSFELTPTTTPNVPTPPPPTDETHTLEPQDDGTFWELGEDGNPLGQWVFNPGTGTWEFEEFFQPTGPALPQTGLLRWPIPILSVGGTAMLSMGAFLTLKGKKRDEE